MPFKSNKQRAYMHAAADRGEIPQKTVAEFDQASKGMDLPQYSSPQKKNRFGKIKKMMKKD